MDTKSLILDLKTRRSRQHSEYLNAYLKIVSTIQSIEEVNGLISELRSVAFENNVATSSFPLKTKPQPDKVNKEREKEQAPPPLPDEQEKNAISGILNAYERHGSFLTLILFKRDFMSSAPTKIAVVHSKILDSNYCSSLFSTPDVVTPMQNFSLDDLDTKCNWLIAFLFWHYNYEETDSISDFITSKNLKVLNIPHFKDDEAGYWIQNRKHDVLKEYFGNRTTPVTDGSLSSEAQVLISSFFPKTAGFITYHKLGGGFSGSTVFKVVNKGAVGDDKHYIIKINQASKKKLEQESDNFNRHVKPFWVKDQNFQAEYKASYNWEALLYPFASDNGADTSISFGHFFKNSLKRPIETEQLISVIFNHSLLKKWRENTNSKTSTISSSLSNIISLEKACELLKKFSSDEYSIAPISSEKITSIFNDSFTHLEMTCHGDLHSDNVLLNSAGSQSYLIDFGLTGKYPIALDYAMLEASIRFKLLEKTISATYLQKHDRPLFEDIFPISSCEEYKNDIEKVNHASLIIRTRFRTDFPKVDITDLRKQYLACLLALSLRQVEYQDLNTRYILKTIESIVSVYI